MYITRLVGCIRWPRNQGRGGRGIGPLMCAEIDQLLKISLKLGYTHFVRYEMKASKTWALSLTFLKEIV